MPIISLSFLLFLTVVIIIYYIVPGKYQWVVLLTSSYCFYAIGDIAAVCFVMATTLLTFASGMLMDRNKRKISSRKGAKEKNRKILITTIILVFGTLFVLKYFHMFTMAPVFNVMLPMGISFYMFQSIGYCIDVYRSTTETEKNIARYALFISFFPLAVQGPISRYGQLGDQLRDIHSFDYRQFTFGAQLMLWGFFKKLIVAENLLVIVDAVFDDCTAFDGTENLIAIVSYALLIYIDFSSGIDIVRGAAQCMGIDLIENFQRPYFADSVAEYWRRWHMALTNWMRDYVFYSLALSKWSNKVGKWGRSHVKGHIGKQLPSYLPTFVTFFLIGIWHGAGWGFIVFGFYNATIIVVSMMLQPVFEKLNGFFHINKRIFLWKIWQIIRTFSIMAIGKCITRAASIGAGLSMLASCAHAFNFSNIAERMLALGLECGDWIILLSGGAVIFAVSVVQERGISIRDWIAHRPLPLRWFVFLIGFAAVLILGVYGPGYDPAAFIYRGF